MKSEAVRSAMAFVLALIIGAVIIAVMGGNPVRAYAALVEGAVASVDDEKKIKKIRAHTKLLVAMGDCAVAGNVPSMRNPIGPEAILNRAYIENADCQQQIPCVVVPQLLRIVRPIHEFVKVDVFLPGCPPSADTFHTTLTALVNGGPLDIPALTRFGA